LLLDGFVYEQLSSDLKLSANIAQTQIDWIRLQPQERFFSQPYEQLAAVLRNVGLPEEGVKVMIKKNEEHARYSASIEDFLWYHVFGWFIGYGYRPWNAFIASLVMIAVGYVLFHGGYRCGLVTPTDKDAYVENYPLLPRLSEYYPRFNALVYSVETFVPLLKLWMSDYWAPNPTRLGKLRIFAVELPLNGPGLRFYLWIHIIMGWVLTTLWVAGLSGLLKT
jgi:hypothetical protein